MKRQAWNTNSRRAFADGNRLRANTVPDQRKRASREACRKWRWRSE